MLTLLPLFAVKLHLNNHWGMIGLSFMTFRAVDVLLYRNKKDGNNVLHYFCYLFMPFIILAGPMYRWRTWMSDVSKPVFALNREQFLVAAERISYRHYPEVPVCHAGRFTCRAALEP